MPASAYYLLSEEQFPNAAEFGAEEPRTLLPDDAEQNVEDVESRVEQSDEENIEECTVYMARHEYRQQLRYLGRARGETFTEYVQIHDFPLFRYNTEPDPLDFRPVVLKTKKKVAFDFLDRLNTHRADFQLDRLEVDLDCLRQRPLVQELKGAWFSEMRSPNMSSTAVYGPHVEQADEFRHAEQHGELSNLTLPFDHAGEAHTIQVTKAGAVVLYESFALDAQALALVMAVATELLAPCLRIED